MCIVDVTVVLCYLLHYELKNLTSCSRVTPVNMCKFYALMFAGSLNHLLKYETEQQRRNLPVLATIHALQCLYSTCFTPVVFGRSLGLSAVDSMKNLKVFFVLDLHLLDVNFHYFVSSSQNL